MSGIPDIHKVPRRRRVLRARPRVAGSSGCSAGAGDAGGVGRRAGSMNGASQDPPSTCAADGGVPPRVMNTCHGGHRLVQVQMNLRAIELRVRLVTTVALEQYLANHLLKS
ncbi:hypothetical protein PIB30_006611 [Stylosanthes scabra]|uniref:Uncharacterized protein n=1 Tax=Stylosanthes scabra TaxID=79078 RepID=A0ABU6Z3H4_9FABA|nr:hypothetical protein [Stylosanthes scabra]